MSDMGDGDLGDGDRIADAEANRERWHREERLYERVLALRGSLVATEKELDALDSKIQVAHLSLERAQNAAAWRFAHEVTRLLRKVTRRRESRGTDAFEAAMARLAALEHRSRATSSR